MLHLHCGVPLSAAGAAGPAWPVGATAAEYVGSYVRRSPSSGCACLDVPTCCHNAPWAHGTPESAANRRPSADLVVDVHSKRLAPERRRGALISRDRAPLKGVRV